MSAVWELATGWLALSGIVGFALMGFDKHQARGAGRWVPEKAFFVLAARLRLVPTGSKVAVKASAAGRKVERPLVNAAVTITGKKFNLRVGWQTGPR